MNDVFEIWIRKQPRFKSFAAYVDSEGARDIAGICERYRDIPSSGVKDAHLFDWGAVKRFSLDGRGAGECAAGPTS